MIVTIYSKIYNISNGLSESLNENKVHKYLVLMEEDSGLWCYYVGGPNVFFYIYIRLFTRANNLSKYRITFPIILYYKKLKKVNFRMF